MFVQPFLGFVRQPAFPHVGTGVALGAFGAAFLTRGLMVGTGVVKVFGLVVVVGSAAFLVRGLADGGGLGLDGDAWCAWAAPAATTPPLSRASANAAARTGRRLVMRTD